MYVQLQVLKENRYHFLLSIKGKQILEQRCTKVLFISDTGTQRCFLHNKFCDFWELLLLQLSLPFHLSSVHLKWKQQKLEEEIRSTVTTNSKQATTFIVPHIIQEFYNIIKDHIGSLEKLRQNPLGNWVILIFSGQKSCTRIIYRVSHSFLHFLRAMDVVCYL